MAEVAALMDAPVTRLYHHVNKLADVGLIQVVSTRQVAAVTERRYQVTARSFSLAPHVFDTSDKAEIAYALGSLFDIAKLGFQRSVEAGLRLDGQGTDGQVALSFGELHLSDKRRIELLKRLEAVIAECSSDLDDDDPDANHITMFIAAFPETA